MIAEWILKDDQIVCRREILQAEQTKMEKNTLFDIESTESAKEEPQEIVVERTPTEQLEKTEQEARQEPKEKRKEENASTLERTQEEQEQAVVLEADSTTTSDAAQNRDVQEATEGNAALSDAPSKKRTRAKKEADPAKPKKTRKSKKTSEETPDDATENAPAEETGEERGKALVVKTFETNVAVVSRLLQENVVELAERFLRNASDAINDENFRVCRFDKSAKLDEALDETCEALTDAQNAARTADLETCRPLFERFSNACQKCCNVVNRISSLSEEKRDELTKEAKEIINAISHYL